VWSGCIRQCQPVGIDKCTTKGYVNPALLAPASYVVVLADARPLALLAPASYAVVLTDARLMRCSPGALLPSLLASASLAVSRLLGHFAPPPSGQRLLLPHTLPFPPHAELSLPCRLRHRPWLAFEEKLRYSTVCRSSLVMCIAVTITPSDTRLIMQTVTH
jgi:hypothetical protein